MLWGPTPLQFVYKSFGRRKFKFRKKCELVQIENVQQNLLVTGSIGYTDKLELPTPKNTVVLIPVPRAKNDIRSSPAETGFFASRDSNL